MRGYTVQPFGVNRRLVAASVAECARHHTIHTITEVDVTEPRRLMREHRERTGEGLSLTAYVVACVGRAIAESPLLNSRRAGRKLIVFDGVTVGTLVEREIDGERVPDMLGIQAAETKSFREIHDEIRAAQCRTDARIGSVSGTPWVTTLVPSFLFKTMVRLASRSAAMGKRYGVVAVTSVGMFAPGPMWLVPLSGSTVAVAVGGIVHRVVPVDGGFETREHLCLTISFDHDIVDGSPAARFTERLDELLSGGELLATAVGGGASEKALA